MDNNKKNKVKDFFKKEGFYLVLFVCLCVVAISAAFTMNKTNTAKQQEKVNNEFSLKVEENVATEDSSNLNKQNAERVENNDEVALDQNQQKEEALASADEQEVAETNNDETAEVVAGTTNEVTFSVPLEGTVSRGFNDLVTLSASGRVVDRYQTRGGVDLTASVGTTVKAAAEGKVEEVSSNTTDGTYVVIAHANGLKTKYTNLSQEVKVAVGDVVEAGAEIGTVGNTSAIFTSEVCGDVLNLQVIDANGNQVNPKDYFNF